MFDLIRTWRLDSGDYEAIAEAVICAWELRGSQLEAAGKQKPPRPKLMHSNLSSVEEVLEVSGYFFDRFLL